MPIASKASLKPSCRDGRTGRRPSEVYRRLFREIYSRPDAELGFPDEPEEDPEATDLRSRLAAAHGEALAAAGHAADARRAFDTTDALLPVNSVDPELPFLFLADSHLDR
ncbi:MAG: hypothetical protein ACRDSL_02870 [Pseudonocardiaceae bacterium]